MKKHECAKGWKSANGRLIRCRIVDGQPEDAMVDAAKIKGGKFDRLLIRAGGQTHTVDV